MKSFDENNIQSITSLAESWKTYDENDTEFFEYNFTKCVEELLKLEDYQYEELRTVEILRLISNLTFRYGANANAADILKDEFYLINDKILDYFINQKKSSAKTYGAESSKFEIILLIFNAFIPFVPYSEYISVKIIHHGIHKKAVTLLRNEAFLNKKMLDNGEALNLFDLLIKFLCSNARNTSNNKALLETDVTEILSEYLNKLNEMLIYKSELKYIKPDIAELLCLLLTETEINKLEISDDIINNYISIFKEILHNGKINKHVFENTKYYTNYMTGSIIVRHVYASGLIKSLTILSLNDQIKERLFNAGILDLLQVIFVDGNIEEKKRASELLASLSFNTKIMNHLKENETTIRLIKNIHEQTKDIDTKYFCSQVIEKTNRNEESLKRSIQANSHKTGYKTWIDAENVFIDLRDTMAKAVENASIVLICYSEEYKNSINCRYEAEYAATLNKKIIAVRLQDGFNPDGWLGLMLASKFYINFSKTELSKNDIYKSLFHKIETLLHVTTKESCVPAANKNSTEQNKKPINWKVEEVKSFLESNNLKGMSHVLSNYNGHGLRGLWEMKEKDYKSFIEHINDEIKQSNIQVPSSVKLSFNGLLSNLFN